MLSININNFSLQYAHIEGGGSDAAIGRSKFESEVSETYFELYFDGFEWFQNAICEQDASS